MEAPGDPAPITVSVHHDDDLHDGDLHDDDQHGGVEEDQHDLDDDEALGSQYCVFKFCKQCVPKFCQHCVFQVLQLNGLKVLPILCFQVLQLNG